MITERDYARLMMSGYFEDITVGGSTVIIIEDLTVLRRKQEMERLVMRVNGLKQKSLTCWILLVFPSSNHRSTTDSLVAALNSYSLHCILSLSYYTLPLSSNSLRYLNDLLMN